MEAVDLTDIPLEDLTVLCDRLIPIAFFLIELGDDVTCVEVSGLMSERDQISLNRLLVAVQARTIDLTQGRGELKDHV